MALQKMLASGVLVILYIFFSLFGRNFLTQASLVNIFNSCYYIGFLAIGTTFVIITGGIDLSIGTTMMCGALIGGMVYSSTGCSIMVALLIVVISSTIMGLINGVLIAYLRLPPFIATLGMQMMSMGFGSILTKVQTMRYPTIGTPDGFFKNIFYTTSTGFPIGILWVTAFFLLAYIVLNKTIFGRYVYAIGSNSEATRLSGVNVRFWTALTYTFCGLYCGFAGIMYAAAYTSIVPGTGNGLELLAIAGVVIGGTSMTGGSGTLGGTIIGVLVMSVLKQGLMSMNLQSQWQTFFTGAVVIGAVLLDNYRIKKQRLLPKATNINLNVNAN